MSLTATYTQLTNHNGLVLLHGWCRAIAAAVSLLLCLGHGIEAAAQSPPAVDGPIERLKPGEYIWAPEIAPDGPVTIIISLKVQRAYAYRNGVPIGTSTVSTGKPGYETPVGVFLILQKDIDHKSNLYDGAPMPFMQRLTWDGIAMHAGNLPGYPASHGCIRLPAAFAQLIFGITKLGLTVVITDDALVPEVAPVPDVLAGSTTNDVEPPSGSYIWRPEKSPSGPLSIVVSGRDKRLIVLRNGIQIGSGTVRIEGPVNTTQAFTLRAADATGVHWMRLPLPGVKLNEAGEVSAEERRRINMPEALRLAILGELKPGTALLVTRDSLRSGGTGRRLTVISADGE